MKTLKGSYRTADGKAQIDWELTEKEMDTQKLHAAAVATGGWVKPVFSATGQYDGGMGQCIDTIAEVYPDDPTVQEMASVWRDWHLNDMQAGCEHQRFEAKTLASRLAVEYQVGQKCPVCGYEYGSAWLYAPIPSDVLAKIESWAQLPARAPLHEDQARNWLREHGLKLRITCSDTKIAPWEPAGHHYRVTLSRESRRGIAASLQPRLVYDFWGSQKQAENGQDPTPYDVLACLSSDVYCPETFGDFCAEYGNDPDSIKAKQIFNRANRFAQRARAFFTDEEIESMQVIR